MTSGRSLQADMGTADPQPRDIYSPVYDGEDAGEHCVLMIQMEMGRKTFQQAAFRI